MFTRWGWTLQRGGGMSKIRRIAVVAVSTAVVTVGYVATAAGAFAGVINSRP